MAKARPQPTDAARRAWRACVFAALAAFFAVSAMAMRGVVGGFGGAAGPLALAAVAALACGLLLAPLAALVELPEAIYGHWLPERRAKRGGCPQCGYSALHAPAASCPECGADLSAPAPYAADWRTLAKGAALALPAWALGCAVGLALVLADERSFAVEMERAKARGPTAMSAYSRPRAWPASYSRLQWSRSDGFSGPPPFGAPKARIQAATDTGPR